MPLLSADANSSMFNASGGSPWLMTTSSLFVLRSSRRIAPGVRLRRARRAVAQTLALYCEAPRVDLASLHYTPEQVCGEWLPGDRAGQCPCEFGTL